jgi:hypothetical protein
VTKVSTPIELEIRSGDKEDAAMIDLGDIDVEEENKSKKYVFCVTSDKECHYGLQLAYTTNIPFKYTIYKATKGKNGDELVAYTTQDGTDSYYTQGDQLKGSYLNQDSSTSIAINDTTNSYWTSTYGGYDNVQKNAMPVYWQSNNTLSGDADSEYEYMKLTANTSDSDNNYTQYYILEVNWEAAKNISNDGETDIIYITTKSI